MLIFKFLNRNLTYNQHKILLNIINFKSENEIFKLRALTCIFRSIRLDYEYSEPAADEEEDSDVAAEVAYDDEYDDDNDDAAYGAYIEALYFNTEAHTM